MQVTVYHNPRCSKSRETLALLRAEGIEPRVVEYLKDPPGRATLERLVGLLGIEPIELVRRREAAFQEARLDREDVTADEVLDAMCAHPELIERPIVVVGGDRAAIGRPPERVLDLL